MPYIRDQHLIQYTCTKYWYENTSLCKGFDANGNETIYIILSNVINY